MHRSTRTQWALVVLWGVLLIGVLYALATNDDSLFQIIALFGVALGTTSSALQLRRRGREQR